MAVAACGVAGAVAGDTVGYQVGRHLGPHLRSSRPGRAVKGSRWDRAEAFIRRYGGASIFLGRWVSFGRVVLVVVGAILVVAVAVAVTRRLTRHD